MKVWITKYALTKGIYEVEARDIGDGMIAAQGIFMNDYYNGEGKEWCRTREEAVQRAEELRQKKIKNLKKQIQKLEDMKFE